MIYLRFPSSQDEMVQYAVLEKPNYSGVLETALKEWYTDSLAAKYAKILADSLYEVMNFPKDGIFYVNPDTQTFFVFSKESNLWVDTKKKIEDYVISSTDKIWDPIFAKHTFLKKAGDLIKSTVEKETRVLFVANTWANISSIDLDSGNISAVGQEDILKIFKDYFSEKRVNELYLEVKKTLFSTASNSIVILFEKESLKGMLTAEGYKKFDQSAFVQVEKMFSEDLEEKDLHEFISRFRNKMLWDYDYVAKYPILGKDHKGVYIEHNGLRLYPCNHWRYGLVYEVEASKVLNIIEQKIRSSFDGRKINYPKEGKGWPIEELGIDVLMGNYDELPYTVSFLFNDRLAWRNVRFACIDDKHQLRFHYDNFKDRYLSVIY